MSFSFVDSICVKIIGKSSLIYGKGNKLLHRENGKNTTNRNTTYDKIHSISCLERSNKTLRIVCSAGREILITTLVDNEFQENLVFKLSDWISSIKILNDESIAVLTAHNHVAIVKIIDGKPSIIEKLRCEENSTLYTSYIHGERLEDLLFFGGTALGELIVWKKCNNSPRIIQDYNTAYHTTYRQFMHNGVIFSIDFNNRYLITSSDDRSIKVFETTIEKGCFSLQEKHQLFGHTARVFVSRIIKYDNRTLFLSAGEDSNLCVWNETGKLLSKKNVSASGCIWNLDYDEKSRRVVTCSSSGKLNSFNLDDVLFENHQKFSIQNNEKIIPAKLKYLDNGALIVLDNKMQLYMKLSSEDWTKIESSGLNQNYVSIEVFENRLLLAGKQSITAYDFCEDSKKLQFTTNIEIKKILPTTISLNYLRAIHAISHNEIAVSDAKGLCLIINIVSSSILNIFQIPKCTEPWTTSVARINDIWLVGDRIGNLYVYENCNERDKISTYVQKIGRLHGQFGVTTIQPLADGFIRTTGNDGIVRTLFLNKEKFPPAIEVHRSEKTSVNWIGKVCNWNQKEYLLGFNDNYFAIYHNGQIIYEHRCGGRHRHWDVVLKDKERRVNFTYIQKKQLNVVEFVLCDFDCDVNDIALHTMDYNTIQALDNGKLLISGSEDTSIKLLNVTEGKLVATVKSHISNIKCLATVKDGDDFLIFSAGGRGQIVITRLREMKFVKEEFDFKLASASKNGNSRLTTLDPETRITSLCYDGKFGNLYIACSDGFLRILRFTRNDNSCELRLIKEHFYGKCLLKVHVVKDFLLTMATDGFVCFWIHDKSSNALTLIDKLKHNQNGINCFDVFECADEGFLIGTSGDDNGCFITKFVIDGNQIKFVKTLSNCSVHTAQVTGLKFTSEIYLYTTSVDQTICKLKVNDSAIEVINRTFSCVADSKGFLFLNERDIVVFGAGLEVLTNCLT